jgi:hypothetical protein
MNQQPIKTEINNGILTGRSAMPMKDSTSNNEAIFSMTRRLYNKSFIPTKSFVNVNGTSFIQRESLGLSNKVVIDGKKTQLQKKWIGGNRDSSSVISNRKIKNMGTILSNSNGPVCFKNVKDNNTERDALLRVRSSGYRVPPSVTQKYKII